jgi:cell division septal protein FtsQ
MAKKASQPMRKEISAPLVVLVIAVVVIAVGVFGWLQLRTPVPNVTPEQTKADVNRQMEMMKAAVQQMKQGNR